VRVSFTWLGVRKTLTPDQKAQAAETFGAEGQYLSAAKKLLDTRCPAFRAVTAVRNQILAYWRGMSVPYPEPGIRLIRQDRIELFNGHMTDMRAELAEAVEELERQYGDLRAAARDRLGSLFNPADYPAALEGLFQVEWEFPSVAPPDYLRDLNPQLYEQERQRMVARFEQAVQLAEQAFTEEFAGLVSHITERLSGAGSEGQAKVFRNSAVDNLREFFGRFRELNVRSNAELDRLVETAQKALRGVQPQALREDQSLRQRISGQLSAVATSLDGLLVDRPRRRILRTHVQAGAGPVSQSPEAGEPAGDTYPGATPEPEPAEAAGAVA
jgi:hypothetical protein